MSMRTGCVVSSRHYTSSVLRSTRPPARQGCRSTNYLSAQRAMGRFIHVGAITAMNTTKNLLMQRQIGTRCYRRNPDRAVRTTNRWRQGALSRKTESTYPCGFLEARSTTLLSFLLALSTRFSSISTSLMEARLASLVCSSSIS